MNSTSQEPIYMKCGKCGEMRIVTPTCFLCADCYYKAMKEFKRKFHKGPEKRESSQNILRGGRGKDKKEGIPTRQQTSVNEGK